jgi:hypothetical protein
MSVSLCGRCRKPAPDDDSDWVTVTVEASPGPRTGRKTSLVTTVTAGFLVCPECWAQPGADLLRLIVTDDWAAAVPELRRCMILCTTPRRRSLLARVNEGNFSRTRCPRCWNVAGVQALGPDARPSMKALANLVKGG